jgi:hypothetical protein
MASRLLALPDPRLEVFHLVGGQGQGWQRRAHQARPSPSRSREAFDAGEREEVHRHAAKIIARAEWTG